MTELVDVANERARMAAALERSGWQIGPAARELGLHHTTLSARIRQHPDLERMLLERNARARASRAAAPARAPHEVSRQADWRRRNAERGLCRCGQPPRDGRKSCTRCSK